MSVQVTTDFRELDKLIRRTGKRVERILHDGVEYGIYNEFGTTRMSARPFIGPGIASAYRPMRDGLGQMGTIENLERFVEKIAQDAAEVARQNILLPPPRVDTSQMLNSVRASKPSEVVL